MSTNSQTCGKCRHKLSSGKSACMAPVTMFFAAHGAQLVEDDTDAGDCPCYDEGVSVPLCSVCNRPRIEGLASKELVCTCGYTRPSPKQEIEQYLETMREEERIRCPHCEAVFPEAELTDGYEELISYWGEDNEHEIECLECEKSFRVRENVRRTFDTAKPGEDFPL